MRNAGGVEIGSDTIKGVRLQLKGRDGRLAVRGVGLRALAGVDPDESPEVYEEDLKAHLRALGGQTGVKASFLKTVAAPRATTIKHMSFPPVPPTRLQEMIRFEVTENLSGNRAVSYAWQSLSTDLARLRRPRQSLPNIYREKEKCQNPEPRNGPEPAAAPKDHDEAEEAEHQKKNQRPKHVEPSAS